MLHNDGDKSTSEHAVTVNGNPQITDTAKFGQAAVFDGVGDYLSIPDSEDWSFGGGDFTIDTWIKRDRSNVLEVFSGQSNVNGGIVSTLFQFDAVNTLRFRFFGSTEINVVSSRTIADLYWHHVAVARDGNILRLFIDGSLEGTVNVIGETQIDISEPYGIGKAGILSGYDFKGSFDEYRITKGTALWTSDFTPPSEPATADANTVLLLDFDTPDGSAESGQLARDEHDVTVNGNPQITDTSRFAQSVYFDGIGDYLEIADSEDWTMGSGDFTIDFWAKRDSFGTSQYVLGQWDSVAGSWLTSSFALNFTPDNKVGALIVNPATGPMSIESTTTITDSSWNHITMSRNGNSLNLFINGVLENTLDLTGVTIANSAYKMGIGRIGEYDGLYYKGNIDEFRITKGEAIWTTNFTPPTEPDTATANTKLLLHMDGAEGSTSFADASSSVHVVTANGDAEKTGVIDTKINGLANEFEDAMYFDGSGDYLSVPDSDDWDFGDGDFTIDFWVNTSDWNGS